VPKDDESSVGGVNKGIYAPPIHWVGLGTGTPKDRDEVNKQNVFYCLFIIRVKRELKRVYKNGCRYNERLNAETGGSKTTHTHWVARVNI
jgi:hypothetical protein